MNIGLQYSSVHQSPVPTTVCITVHVPRNTDTENIKQQWPVGVQFSVLLNQHIIYVPYGLCLHTHNRTGPTHTCAEVFDDHCTPSSGSPSFPDIQ